jgi:hypothetical protein
MSTDRRLRQKKGGGTSPNGLQAKTEHILHGENTFYMTSPNGLHAKTEHILHGENTFYMTSPNGLQAKTDRRFSRKTERKKKERKKISDNPRRHHTT